MGVSSCTSGRCTPQITRGAPRAQSWGNPASNPLPSAEIPKFALPLLPQPSNLSWSMSRHFGELAYSKAWLFCLGRPPRSGHSGHRSPVSARNPCPYHTSRHGRVICPGTGHLCCRHPRASAPTSFPPAVTQQGGPTGVFRHCGAVGETHITAQGLCNEGTELDKTPSVIFP